MTQNPIQKEILFQERQHFKQWWIWLIVFGIGGLFLYAFFEQIIEGRTFGSKPMSNFGLILLTGLVILMIILFLITRLETRITDQGIDVRFFPFQISSRHYRWEQLSKVFVRKYNPLTEYGGWGLRYGFGKRAKALSVSGNMGLQLEFEDSKKLLIGTRKPGELTEVLRKIEQLRH